MKNLKRASLTILTLMLVTFGYTRYHNMNINDIGLSILSWVKNITGNAVPLDQLSSSTSLPVDHQSWTVLLQKFVDVDGNVDYAIWQKEQGALQIYLDRLSANPPGKKWSEAERLAYWINAYNAFTVKLILNHYPLESIKEISDGLTMVGSPWDIKFFKIGKLDFDLNTIEHEILRKQFNEPRIHFAINCASTSCPKLRNEAFTASRLDTQVNEQTLDFLNDKNKNNITSDFTRLSKIFDWFQSDFTKNNSLKNFISNYKPEMNPKNKIEWLDYDWLLNEAN